MLVLSRHADERVFLDVPGVGRIIFTVVAIRGDNVRLGITAPREVQIYREEVAERLDLDVPRDPELPQSLRT